MKRLAIFTIIVIATFVSFGVVSTTAMQAGCVIGTTKLVCVTNPAACGTLELEVATKEYCEAVLK